MKLILNIQNNIAESEVTSCSCDPPSSDWILTYLNRTIERHTKAGYVDVVETKALMELQCVHCGRTVGVGAPSNRIVLRIDEDGKLRGV
jgi:hypothetical protein